jgi:hypothetical protein
MLATLLLRCAAAALIALPTLAQTPGAALVLNRFGVHAEGNSFVRKDGAYLSGGPGVGCLGPGACASAGLADGDYCFQITDPAGSVLLTTDPLAERCVRVKNGVVAQYLGTTRLVGRNAPCGAIQVRLVPFDTTPQPTSEYKVWLTRIADYDVNGKGVFGFDPRRSKSENFRVQSSSLQTIVRGHKYYDENQDGVWTPLSSANELAIGGWRVELYKNGALDGVTFTDQDGTYIFIRDRDGSSYAVREVAPGGFINDAVPGALWLATAQIESSVTASSECVAGPEFGNVAFELIPRAGRTADAWATHNCGHSNNPDHPHYPCGESLLEDCDPTWREVLTTRNGAPVNLRKPISSDVPSISVFVPPPLPTSMHHAFNDWRHYENRNPHDHAGFILSREVAATLLSHSCGSMQGTIYIDRFQDGVLVSLEDMLTGVIGLLSETGAGLTGPNDPYQDLRMRMLNCLNEFRTINQTGDPGAPQVVYGPRPSPLSYETPY